MKLRPHGLGWGSHQEGLAVLLAPPEEPQRRHAAEGSRNVPLPFVHLWHLEAPVLPLAVPGLHVAATAHRARLQPHGRRLQLLQGPPSERSQA